MVLDGNVCGVFLDRRLFFLEATIGRSRGVSGQLGLELRRIREERGLSVEELAEKSRISATTIRAVERGSQEARGDTVARLAKPLGLMFDEVWRLQRKRG